MRKLKGMSSPGPGHYPIQQSEGITPNGRFVNSKHPNLPNYNFGFGIEKKESEITKIGKRNANKSPDPGRYYTGIVNAEKIVKNKGV